MSDDLCGVILIGGKSSRMETDKFLLNYHGTTQLNYLNSLLSSFCKKIYISCNANQSLPLNEYNALYDDLKYGDHGPYSALLSILNFTKSAVLVIGCDYPFLGSADISLLINNRDKQALATCFNGNDNLPEPLLSIYEGHALIKLKESANANNFSLRQFLLNNSHKKVEGCNTKSFISVDTKAAYDQIIALRSLIAS